MASDQDCGASSAANPVDADRTNTAASAASNALNDMKIPFDGRSLAGGTGGVHLRARGVLA